MSARLARRLYAAARATQAEQVAVGDLLQAHGTAASGSLLLLLAVPCVLPIPGTGTVLGLGLLALAWALWQGRTDTLLPRRVAQFQLSRSRAQQLLKVLARVYLLAGRLTRARLGWALNAQALRGLALLVAAMAVVLILPIPFGNLLPALALVLIGLGLVARDGLATLLGAALATLTAVGTVALLVLAAQVVQQGGAWTLAVFGT